VYTVRENVNLVEIFMPWKKLVAALPMARKDGIKKIFEKTSPLDFERVYASDLKKMVKWFDILKKNEVEIKLSEPEVAVENEEEVKRSRRRKSS